MWFIKHLSPLTILIILERQTSEHSEDKSFKDGTGERYPIINNPILNNLLMFSLNNQIIILQIAFHSLWTKHISVTEKTDICWVMDIITMF